MTTSSRIAPVLRDVHELTMTFPPPMHHHSPERGAGGGRRRSTKEDAVDPSSFTVDDDDDDCEGECDLRASPSTTSTGVPQVEPYDDTLFHSHNNLGSAGSRTASSSQGLAHMFENLLLDTVSSNARRSREVMLLLRASSDSHHAVGADGGCPLVASSGADSPIDIARLASVYSPVKNRKSLDDDSFDLDDDEDGTGGGTVKDPTDTVRLLENSSRYVIELEESAEYFDMFQLGHSLLMYVARQETVHAAQRATLMDQEASLRWRCLWRAEAVELSDILLQLQHEHSRGIHASAVAERVMLGVEISALHRDKEALCRSALQFALNTVGTIKDAVSAAVQSPKAASAQPAAGTFLSHSTMEQETQTTDARERSKVDKAQQAPEASPKNDDDDDEATKARKSKEAEEEQRARLEEDLAHTKLELLMQTAAAVGASHSLRAVYDKCGEQLAVVPREEDRQRNQIIEDRLDFLSWARQLAISAEMVLQLKSQQDDLQAKIVASPPLAAPDNHQVEGSRVDTVEAAVQVWCSEASVPFERYVEGHCEVWYAAARMLGDVLMSAAEAECQLLHSARSEEQDRQLKADAALAVEAVTSVEVWERSGVAAHESKEFTALIIGFSNTLVISSQARIDDAQREMMKFQHLYADARDKLAQSESAAHAYRASAEQQLATLRDHLQHAHATASEANVKREADSLAWETARRDLQEALDSALAEKLEAEKRFREAGNRHVAESDELGRTIHHLEQQLREEKREVESAKADRMAAEVTLHKVKQEAKDAQTALLRHKDTEIAQLVHDLKIATDALQQQQQKPPVSPSAKPHLLRSAVEQSRRQEGHNALGDSAAARPSSPTGVCAGTTPAKPLRHDLSAASASAASDIDLIRQLSRAEKANEVLRKRVLLLQARLGLMAEVVAAPARGNPASSMRRTDNLDAAESGHALAAAAERALALQKAASDEEISLLREEVDRLERQLGTKAHRRNRVSSPSSTSPAGRTADADALNASCQPMNDLVPPMMSPPLAAGLRKPETTFLDPTQVTLLAKEAHFVAPSGGVKKENTFAYNARDDPHLRGFFSTFNTKRFRSPPKKATTVRHRSGLQRADSSAM